MNELPRWAVDMRDQFKSGSVSQFIIHGNVFDVVPVVDASRRRLLSVRSFLEEVMFASYDVVLHYDRGRGIRATRGADDWSGFLEDALGAHTVSVSQTREPGAAMELLDRYLLRSLNLAALSKTGSGPRRIAIVIDFAEFVVPRGDALALSGPFGANVIKVLGWANDPAIHQANIATVLITENLHDLSDLVIRNPHVATLQIPLPGEPDMLEHVRTLAETEFPGLEGKCEVPMETLARRLTGLSRVGARKLISSALMNQGVITAEWLTRMKKELIERECQGLLEFMESPFTLDHVAGHEPVKAWLREDARLLKRGALHTLPMGYLITGRIGTGKTFIVQCWAGELGIPCVVFKNFRDRWVGATESNLEKIFAVLHALGQVVVFVDEADQAAGRRDGGDGDGGLSGRVYAALAKEMSETRNRGRIVWVFATSRPDLVEVDLKRQGRLDVHIPLFPPESPGEVRSLFISVARKLKFPLAESDIPDIPAGTVLSGNEIEGMMVRALRMHELEAEPRRPLLELLRAVFADVRPNAHTKKLEYMDLVAVKECTDAAFLPPRFRQISLAEVERRLDELRKFV